MSPGMRAANAALMNLASLDDLVRGFQHLALAIREHCTKAAPGETAESSSTSFKKCQLLLRAALNGCKRAKVRFLHHAIVLRYFFRLANTAAPADQACCCFDCAVCDFECSHSCRWL